MVTGPTPPSDLDILRQAADICESLHEGSKHIPADLIHDRGYRVGWVHEGSATGDLVAQFHYGGAAEVFLTLGPAFLPLLAATFRSVAKYGSNDSRVVYRVPGPELLAMARHIIERNT
jgi:hypothetical protein